MSRPSRGMVLLTALIMMTMLALTTASALRSATLSTRDIAWIQDEWRTRLAMDQALRNALAMTKADHSSVPATVSLQLNGVDVTWQSKMLGYYAANPFWGGGSCIEILVTGSRRGLVLAHATIACLPTDATQPSFVTWREEAV
ncbi:MAG: hypothetical protein AAFN07_13215 [Pseudomonadota bacterium]